ncbi:MAG: ComEC/Rec2 family competence protein [Tepidisphaeraceae bacterium]
MDEGLDHPPIDAPAERPQPPGMVAARPLAPVAVALMIGIALLHVVPVLPWVWLAVAGVLTLLCLRCRRPTAWTACFLLAVGCSGLALGQLAAYRYAPIDIARFASDDRRLCQVEFQLSESPRIVTMDAGQHHALPARQTALVDVTAVKTWASWQPATGRALLQINEPNPQLAAGQRVRMLGTLDRPAPAMNPGQFDWAAYYRQQRILASLHVVHANNLTILERHPPSWHTRWCDWTRAQLGAGFSDEQSLDHALLRALVLGDSDPELRDVQEAFRATGTSHHLAISGMHVAVMGAVVFFALRLLRRSPRTAWWVALLFVLAYGWAVLPSPPVVRAVLMWLAIGVAVLSRRSIDVLHLLALIVIAMLIYQPIDLFNAGFQLSFGTVLGLILLVGPVSRMLGVQPASDDGFTPTQKILLRVAARIDSEIILILSAALVAWIVSLPIVATHFSQLNPWAVFASIALAPIVLVSLVGGVLKILLTALWPSVASGWAWIAQQPIHVMRATVEWLARLPAGDIALPAPPAWVILLFYLTLLVAIFHTRRASIRLLARAGFGFALLAILLLPYRTSIAQSTGTGELRFTLLSVGAGECIVIEPPSHRVLVVDAGSLSLADPVRKCIGPFLRARGITSIDTLAITNADTDHYGAAAELVRAYDVREVLTAEHFEQLVSRNAVGQHLLKSLNDAQRPPRHLDPGQQLPLGTDTTIDVLWPPRENQQFLDNDQSLVLRLTHAGTRALITGDIQSAAMTALLADPAQLRADVLIAPHHGSSEPTTPAFVQAVHPRVILSSNDRSLTQKQVRFENIVRGIPLYRTNACGAITLHLRPQGQLTLDTALPPSPTPRLP